MFTRIVPGSAPDGTPILSVLGKETFTIQNNAVAQVDNDSPIDFHESDIYWGDNPLTDPLKHESDMVAFKPTTDILFGGNAKTPKGRQAKFFDLTVSVGAFTKTIRIIGNRTVKKTTFGFEISEPELFNEMPLHAGLAYGGKDTESDEGIEYIYQKNSIGKGFVVKERTESLHDLQLPNIEDPEHLLTSKNLILKDYKHWREAPNPAGIGPVAKNSYPRYLSAGLTMEQYIANEASRKEAIENGAPPQSLGEGSPLINPMFFNSAQIGLRAPYLIGNEMVTMLYMDAEHPKFQCRLPGIKPKAWLNIGEGVETMDTVIHTIEVHKETNQLTMVWRACSNYAGIESMKDFTAFDYGIEVQNAS